jgi:hypothetical protein
MAERRVTSQGGSTPPKSRLRLTMAWHLAAIAFTLAVALGSCSPPTWAASSVSQPETRKQTTPQGRDPPGADNGEPLPPTGGKEVIPPPPTGDEDIYTDAPSPDAGHEKEVIPAPGPESEPNRTRPMIAR